MSFRWENNYAQVGIFGTNYSKTRGSIPVGVGRALRVHWLAGVGARPQRCHMQDVRLLHSHAAIFHHKLSINRRVGSPACFITHLDLMEI